MASKTLFVLCAQAIFIQMAMAQAIFPNSGCYSGNTLVDNNIVINSGNGIPSYLNLGNGLGSSLASGIVGSGISGISSSGLASSGFVNPGFVASGGPLVVTAISPIGPSGLAVASENVIEGVLTVNGQLPYLSALAFEGALPTAGAGSSSCGCGNGEVGIVNVGLNNGGRFLY